jgi:hypothetical protein
METRRTVFEEVTLNHDGIFFHYSIAEFNPRITGYFFYFILLWGLIPRGLPRGGSLRPLPGF